MSSPWKLPLVVPANFAEVAREHPDCLAEFLEQFSNKPVVSDRDDLVLSYLRAWFNGDFVYGEPPRHIPGVIDTKRKERAIHVAVKAPSGDENLITMLLELGLDIDKRVDNRRLCQDQPLAMAFERSKYRRAQALLNAGVLVPVKIKRPFTIRHALLTSDQVKILDASWQYAKEGMKSLARLLVDNDWYAIYHRLRNPKIKISVKDLHERYNGVNFLQLLPHFSEFRGGEEINYRLSVDLCKSSLPLPPFVLPSHHDPRTPQLPGKLRQFLVEKEISEKQAEEHDRFLANAAAKPSYVFPEWVFEDKECVPDADGQRPSCSTGPRVKKRIVMKALLDPELNVEGAAAQ